MPEPKAVTISELASVNNAFIADGVHMNLEQMRMLLQEYHQVPIALRKEGSTTLSCPFCHKLHHDPDPPGHHAAGCDEWNAYSITIGGRTFVSGYGNTVYEYRDRDTSPGVRELLVPPNVDPPIWNEMQRAFNNI